MDSSFRWNDELNQFSYRHSSESWNPVIIKAFMKDNFYIYILASKKNGTLYIGITNDLTRRVSEHKSKLIKGFTEKYGVDKLVYYEWSNSINSAIQREKQLKVWQRKWKIELIEKDNKEWKDLYGDLFK